MPARSAVAPDCGAVRMHDRLHQNVDFGNLVIKHGFQLRTYRKIELASYCENRHLLSRQSINSQSTRLIITFSRFLSLRRR